QFPPGRAGDYTIPDGVTTIGAGAFEGCSGLTNVSISGGVTHISSYAFGYCGGLASITLPDSITSIGSFAFAECSALRSVFFLGNAPAADSTIFTSQYYAPAPTVYYLPGTTGWTNKFGNAWTLLWDRLDQFGYSVLNN